MFASTTQHQTTNLYPQLETHATTPPTPRPQHRRGPTWVTRVTAAIATGKHPDPSRTRKLSLPAPMVLPPRGGGRVGRRRTYNSERATSHGGPFAISLADFIRRSPWPIPRARHDLH